MLGKLSLSLRSSAKVEFPRDVSLTRDAQQGFQSLDEAMLRSVWTAQKAQTGSSKDFLVKKLENAHKLKIAMYQNIGGFVTAQIFTSEMSIAQYVSVGSAINLTLQIIEKIFYSQKWNLLSESVKNHRGLCTVTTFFESLANKPRLL